MARDWNINSGSLPAEEDTLVDVILNSGQVAKQERCGTLLWDKCEQSFGIAFWRLSKEKKQ